MGQKKDKLLIGPRLRRFRQTLGLTQARMAEDLGISTSYLNLMERNQRTRILSLKFMKHYAIRFLRTAPFLKMKRKTSSISAQMRQKLY